MWEQQAFNVFTDGQEVIKIDCLDTEHYLVWKNEEFEADLDSFEKLQAYLKEHRIGTISLPDTCVKENEWHSFGGNDHYEEVFTRSLGGQVIQAVIVCHYEERGDYSVLMRTCGYEWIEWLAYVSFEFAEEKGRAAKNLLELDAYEAGTHGSSGMVTCQYDLKTREEVNKFMKEAYGIESVKETN